MDRLLDSRLKKIGLNGSKTKQVFFLPRIRLCLTLISKPLYCKLLQIFALIAGTTIEGTQVRVWLSCAHFEMSHCTLRFMTSLRFVACHASCNAIGSATATPGSRCVIFPIAPAYPPRLTSPRTASPSSGRPMRRVVSGYIAAATVSCRCSRYSQPPIVPVSVCVAWS